MFSATTLRVARRAAKPRLWRRASRAANIVAAIHPAVSCQRHPSVRGNADQGDSTTRRRRTLDAKPNPAYPTLECGRPLLGGSARRRCPGRAAGLARGAGACRSNAASAAAAFAAGLRRAAGRQDLVPAAAGAAACAPMTGAVFEAGGADLQADQVYIGELEGRIRKVIEELANGHKLIWYIPDILQMAMSGRHHGQSATMLDQIMPAIAVRPADRLVRGERQRHGAAGTDQAVAARPVRDRNARTAVAGRNPVAGARGSRRSSTATRISGSNRIAPRSRSTPQASISATAALPGSVLFMLKLTAMRAENPAGRHHGAARARNAVAVLRPAAVDARHPGTARSQIGAGFFHRAGDRPGRGGRGHRRAHRHAQGRAERSRTSRSAFSCSPGRPAPARPSWPRRPRNFCSARSSG